MTADALTADGVAPPQAAARPANTYRAEFRGNAREYFGIWIVNVALSIVTLGIYSAWATVRNNQYFYGNTRINGSSFEYTANPVAILKGRAFVLGVLLIYNLSWSFAPLLGIALALVIVPLVPWVVVRALAFRARNSTYRNLRFSFESSYWDAFKVYVLWMLVVMISLGIAYPYVDYLRKRFAARGHRYGATKFDFEGEAGFFFVVHICTWVAAGFAMGVLMVVGFAGAAVLGASLEGTASDANPVVMGILTVLFTLLFMTVSVAATACVKTLLTNHVWQHTNLGEVRFDMRMNPARIVWIQISNLVMIVATLGLMIPYARVRMARYRASCFAVLSDTPLDQFVAGNAEQVGATGAEFGDALELDLAL